MAFGLAFGRLFIMSQTHLTLLRNKGCFEEVVVHVAKDKPGWIELVITGVGEQFAPHNLHSVEPVCSVKSKD
jgi:hypothetical protein